MTASAGEPLVSIIVPAFNLWDFTRRCLESIARHTADVPHEVIVVDDASTDETPRELPRSFPGVRVIRNQTNQGFARNNNAAAAIARGKYLCLLNNDTEVHAGWLAELVRVADSDPSIGVVGCKLLFPDGTLQHAGVAFAYGGSDPIAPFHLLAKQPASASDRMLELNAVTAACALIPRALYLQLGGFDDGYFMGYEDVDLCLQVRARGLRIVYTPHAVVTHHESISEGRFAANRRNIERLHAKWLGHFDAPDIDFRRPPRDPRPDREGASIVVVVHDDLATAPPALENIRYALAAQDELIVVDDGSRGATAKYLELFAAAHPGRVRCVHCADRLGFAAAARVGLEAGSRPYAVVLPPVLRVMEGWVDRLVAHLCARPDVGVVCPVEADAWNLDDELVFAPEPRGRAGLALPPARAAGDVTPSRFPASLAFAGERARLNDCTPALLGDDPAALADQLTRQGLQLATAQDVPAFHLRQMFPPATAELRHTYLERLSRCVREASTADGPLSSVVVVARDHAEELSRCLAALASHTRGNVEVIVVDDGSRQDLRASMAPPLVAGRAARVLRNDVAQGFARASNQGLAAAQGQTIVVLSGDAIVTRGWLERLRATIDLTDAIGVVAPTSNVGPGPQLADSFDFGPQTPTMSIDAFADQRRTGVWGHFGGVTRVGGTCVAIKRPLLDRIGGFDPRYGDDGGDVDDFCLRAHRAGFRVALAADAYVHSERRLPARSLVLHPKRPPPAGWLKFCERWSYPVAATSREELAALFRTGVAPFDDAKDRVPLDAPPRPTVRLATNASRRVLAWPRYDTPDDAAVLADRFGPTLVAASDVCLCLRHDRGRDGDFTIAAQVIANAFTLRFGTEVDLDVLFVDDDLDDAGWRALAQEITCVLTLPSSRLPTLGRPVAASSEDLRRALVDQSPSPAPRRTPSVSVIMPTHDRPDLLARALDSLVRQTFKDFEVIIVNDAGRSIDDVVDRYRARMDVTTVRHGINRDRAAARNTGLRVALGTYVAYLDDDDYYRPEHLDVLVRTLRQRGARVAYTDTIINHEERTATGVRLVGTEPMPSQPFHRDLLLVRNYIPVLALMHERSCLDEIGGGFDEALGTHEDWELFVRLALRFDFVHVPRVTAEFSVRADGSSTTSSRRPDFARTARIIYDRHRDAVRDRPDLQRLQAQWLAMMTEPATKVA